MLRLHDTALGQVVPIAGEEGQPVSMYVCGPTVYGEAHAGHGRFVLVWDILRRYLQWSGRKVRFVSNVTDVDDKIIARGHEEGRSPAEVAADYEARWWKAMDALGVERPDEIPHATAYIPQMVELIADLIDRGHAYVGGDGVYFAAESVPGYGLLALQPLSSLKAGARVEVSAEAGKRAPIDFALWKLARPGEPTWESPWGDGRPGWHTECVVMSLGLLGEGFDLHGGGIDLAFPHHENERAQALGAGREFARHWVHSAMVVAEGGAKMAKSEGNAVSLPELLERYPARAFRLAVLQAHYRSPMTISESVLAASEEGVERIDAFAREFAAARTHSPDPELLARFSAHMDDDLDTPGAVADLFSAMRAARAATGEEAAALASAVLELWEGPLGVAVEVEQAELTTEAAELARRRDAARAAGDWALADELRTLLQAQGWIVEDTAAGTTIRR